MGNEKTVDEIHNEEVPLFRYGMVADLADVGRHVLYKKLREKAARDHDIPGSTRRLVAPKTPRGWPRDPVGVASMRFCQGRAATTE